MRRQEITEPIALQAHIPVELRCPAEMVWHLAQVLEGEYESGYVGERLRVLDIGANAGAFSIWAAHRWPGSMIDAYEPNPGTFPLLQANTLSYPMIRCHNLAVYPSAGEKIAFTSRYPGDGEAGVVEALADTFRQGGRAEREFFDVPALHPRELPPADIVKIDVEGAEAEIVKHANFSAAALLLIEYQYSRNFEAIKAGLATEYDPILEQQFPYAPTMSKNTPYQRSLAGDYYGHLFLLRRGQTRLRLLQPPTETRPANLLRLLAKSLLPPVLVTALRKAREGLRW
jgi:FkbM family methyltransferase